MSDVLRTAHAHAASSSQSATPATPLLSAPLQRASGAATFAPIAANAGHAVAVAPLAPMAANAGGAHAGQAAAAAGLAPMAHIAINVAGVQNARQQAPVPQPAQPSNLSKFVAHGTDAAAAVLSVMDARVAQAPHLRSMVSGALWAASGPASAVVNRHQPTAATIAADALNTFAGTASVVATALHADQPAASAQASFASNAAWMGAGFATMHSGYQKFSTAPGWINRQAFSGSMQMASGLANAFAGYAGIRSASSSQIAGIPDPVAASWGMTSAVAWALGSGLGVLSTLTSPR